MPASVYLRRIEFFIRRAEPRSRLSNEAKVLFVGCGDGQEARCLGMMNPKLTVIGLDIKLPPRSRTAEKASLIRADASNLPFPSSIIDFCYCYHVLEHVEDYSACVAEMARVLSEDGELYLSTPNSKRLLAYVMSVSKEPFQAIVRANLGEWLARLKGEFVREKGYHCGFTMKELSNILACSFRKIRIVSDDYTLYMASRTALEPIVKLLSMTRLLRLIAPSHTVYGDFPRKGA